MIDDIISSIDDMGPRCRLQVHKSRSLWWQV